MNNVRNSFLFISSVLMLGAVLVAGAWTSAPLNPPANNVAAPINVGNVFQIKEGGLQLRGLFVEGKGVFSTSTYSIPSNTTFAVNGAVSANSYCDVNGQNCKSAADIASAVTGSNGGDKIICGGWDTKYGAGTVDGSQWGCVSAGATSCPTGYDAVSSSHATINNAEHTNLCVLSRAGGGSSVVAAGIATGAVEKNLGSAGSLISFTGSYNSSDAAPTGGYIYKSGSAWKVSMVEATGIVGEFTLTATNQCAHTMCFRTTGGDVLITPGSNTVSYLITR